jgi:CheY-like chemotaxis protein
MKILLIDDNAYKGWKKVIEKVFLLLEENVEVAINSQEAETKILNEKFDLIFLDVRLSEQDHEFTEPINFSGYKILKKIKLDFLNENFSTPIILMTATNKIWNVDAFRNYGVDGFYIKEHPDYVFDKYTSLQNYNNLKSKFNQLMDVGLKRKEVWNLSKKIIKIVQEHSYFKENKKYVNIQNRIVDKLKLGYAYMFKDHNELEKEVLKTNNESIAFIIYWSIYEEMVKGYSEYSNWNFNDYSFTGKWKFRNNEYFIENNGNEIEVNISKDKFGNYLPYTEKFSKKKIDNRYLNGKIYLSEQVYSLLAAYEKQEKQFKMRSEEFRRINEFRNKIDFIHSEILNIYEKPLIEKEISEKQYKFCILQLKFLEYILSLIEKKN